MLTQEISVDYVIGKEKPSFTTLATIIQTTVQRSLIQLRLPSPTGEGEWTEV
jgi:hypothetical protein